MNWTIIAATILVTTKLASLITAPEIVTHLSADLRLSLQDPGAFQICANVSAIPDAVRKARRLAKVALSRSFCMIFYERGGRAHSYHVAAFSNGATFVWHAVFHEFVTEPGLC
jgi:hypothetical protein